jgi:competence protein ComEA
MRFSMQHTLAVVMVVGLLALAGPTPTMGAESSHPIDINSATAAELANLPGIGESKAKAIVEYRAVDPFKSVDDLKKVKGIGEKTLEALRSDITVAPEVGKR